MNEVKVKVSQLKEFLGINRKFPTEIIKLHIFADEDVTISYNENDNKEGDKNE